MLLLNDTASEPTYQLAIDEALIEAAEAGELSHEVLRLSAAGSTYIVLGRSGKVGEEIDVAAAHRDGVPILRRASGGGTVVAARGCHFFSVLLSLQQRPELQMIDRAHEFVMRRLVASLLPLVPDIRFQGTCDLTVADKKVSGNSLRLKRDWLLYHGTLLLNMDLGLVSRYLKHPPREPSYRSGRQHAEFLANLNLPPDQVNQHIQREFGAIEPLQEIPDERARELITQKYALESWNLSR